MVFKWSITPGPELADPQPKQLPDFTRAPRVTVQRNYCDFQPSHRRIQETMYNYAQPP